MLRNIEEPMDAEVYLITRPCQFTDGKTQAMLNADRAALEDAERAARLAFAQATLYNAPNNVKSECSYVLNIHFTNNSLIEVNQFMTRVKKESDKYEDRFNVASFSSEKIADFNCTSDIVLDIIQNTDPNKMVNTIIACTHPKRLNDIMELIEILDNDDHGIHENFRARGITSVTVNIAFDEIDIPKNVTLMCSFLEKVRYKSPVSSVYLITATPYENFWVTLRDKCGITELNNLHHKTNVLDQYDLVKVVESYRQLKEHEKYSVSAVPGYISCKSIVNRSISIVEHIMKTYPNEVLTLFVPGSRAKKTHNQIRSNLIMKDFIVITINGTDKNIQFNKNYTVTLYDYTIQYFGTKEVEMHQIVGHIRKCNPRRGIAITGFICVERGVTFQSKTEHYDSIFSDAIVPYRSDELSPSTFDQIFGRCSGDKKYIPRANRIWADMDAIEQSIARQEQSIDIFLNNSKYPTLNASNFERPLTDKEKAEADAKALEEVKKVKPQLISVDTEVMNMLVKRRGSSGKVLDTSAERKKVVFDYLRDHHGITFEGWEDAVKWHAPLHEDDPYYKNTIAKIIKSEAAWDTPGSKRTLPFGWAKTNYLGNGHGKMFAIDFDIPNNNIIIQRYDNTATLPPTADT